MNSFNPFMSIQNQINAKTKINPDQFMQGISSLNKEKLVQLVQRARAKGINDEAIEAGLNFILQNQK